MVFTKFLGIVLACYAVYYLFIVVVDLIKSKTATATDGKSKHAVRHLNIPDNQETESEKVSKSTHLNHLSPSPSDNKNIEQEKEDPTTSSKKETTEKLAPPVRETSKESENEERPEKSAADILGSDSLEYINTQTEQFNLRFEERTGEGFELSPENAPQIIN